MLEDAIAAPLVIQDCAAHNYRLLFLCINIYLNVICDIPVYNVIGTANLNGLLD